MTSPPCGHPFADPPAPDCPLCGIREVPFHRQRWTTGTAPAAYAHGHARGPGTELKALLAQAGFAAGGCACDARATEMDRWGPAGCRHRRDEIIGWLREEYEKLGRLARLGAGLRTVRGRLVFDLLDPVGGLVDEAIRRAEGKTGNPQPPAG